MLKFRSMNADDHDEKFCQHLQVSKEELDAINWAEKSLDFWKQNLTPVQFKVCRKNATERSFTGKLVDEKRAGIYQCSNCGLKLFKSEHKFDSKTGWPSFFDIIKNESLLNEEDRSLGMIRTEVKCSRCDSHLGHVFPDGPAPTGLRYCINSVSLYFKENS